MAALARRRRGDVGDRLWECRNRGGGATASVAGGGTCSAVAVPGFDGSAASIEATVAADTGGGAAGAAAADGTCGDVAGTSLGAATGGNGPVADAAAARRGRHGTGEFDVSCSGLVGTDVATSGLPDGAAGDAAMSGTGCGMAGTAGGGATASVAGGGTCSAVGVLGFDGSEASIGAVSALRSGPPASAASPALGSAARPRSGETGAASQRIVRRRWRGCAWWWVSGTSDGLSGTATSNLGRCRFGAGLPTGRWRVTAALVRRERKRG